MMVMFNSVADKKKSTIRNYVPVTNLQVHCGCELSYDFRVYYDNNEGKPSNVNYSHYLLILFSHYGTCFHGITMMVWRKLISSAGRPAAAMMMIMTKSVKVMFSEQFSC